MIENLSPSIVNCWSGVSRLRKSLLLLDELEQEPLLILKRGLLELKSERSSREDPALQFIINSIEERIADSYECGHALSPSEKDKLLEKCEEIHMHFLMLLIASQSLISDKTDVEIFKATLDNIREKSNGTIIKGKGGVIYGKVSGIWAIILPNIESKIQSHQILDELLTIYDMSNPMFRWVIDFSAIRTLPIVLIGTLLGYRLAPHPIRMSICWMNPNLLQPILLRKVYSAFNCRKIGNYLFSRPD